jgi:hypothetical protein
MALKDRLSEKKKKLSLGQTSSFEKPNEEVPPVVGPQKNPESKSDLEISAAKQGMSATKMDLTDNYSLLNFMKEQAITGATFGIADYDKQTPKVSDFIAKAKASEFQSPEFLEAVSLATVGTATQLVTGYITAFPLIKGTLLAAGAAAKGLSAASTLKAAGSAAPAVAKAGKSLGTLAQVQQKATIAAKGVKQAKAGVIAARSIGGVDDIASAKAALSSARVANIKAQAASAAFEGGVVGGFSRGTQAAIEGQDFPDIVGEAAFGAIAFSAMGAGIAGGLTTAGAALPLTAFSKDLKSYKQSVEGLLAQESTKNYIKTLLSVPKESLDEIIKNGSDDKMVSAASTIRKLRFHGNSALKPYQVLSDSDTSLLQKISDEDIVLKARQAFTEDGAPLAKAYNTNPELRKLVDEGKYAEAFEAVGQTIHETVSSKEGRDFAKLITGPLTNDTKKALDWHFHRSVKKVTDLATKKSGKTKVDPSEVYNKTKALFYDIEEKAFAPSSDGSKTARVLSPEEISKKDYLVDAAGIPKHKASFQKQVKQSYKKIVFSTGMDVNQVANYLDDQLGSAFKALRGTGEVNWREVGFLRDHNELIRNFSFRNKNLNKSIVQRFSEAPSDIFDSFAKPPEGVDQSLVRSLMKENSFKKEIQYFSKEYMEKMAEAAAETDPIQKELFKDEAKAISSKLSDLRGLIRETINERPLNAKEGSEIYLKAKEFADKAWNPSRGIMENLRRGAGEPERFSAKAIVTAQAETGKSAFATKAKQEVDNVLDSLMSSENPMMIKNNTEFADFLSSIHSFGDPAEWRRWKDLDLPNLLRSADKVIDAQYGYGNPFSKLMYMNRKLDGAVIDDVVAAPKLGKTFNIKPKSEEDFDARRLIKGFIDDTALQEKYGTDAEGLKKISEIKALSNFFKATQRDWFDRVNKTRTALGLKPLNDKGETYVHQMVEKNHFRKILPQKEPPLSQRTTFSPKYLEEHTKGRSRDLNVGIKKQQTRVLEDVQTEYGWDEILQDYVKQASSVVHKAGLASMIDRAKIWAPPKTQEFLSKFNDEMVRNAGKFEDNEGVTGAVLDTVRNMRFRSILLNSVPTMLKQSGSLPATFALSPAHAVKSVMNFASQTSDDVVKQSANIKLRDHTSMDFDNDVKFWKGLFEGMKNAPDDMPLLKAIGEKGEKARQSLKKVGDAHETMLKIGKWAINKADVMFAKHNFLTFHSEAKAQGLGDEQAAFYADFMTDRIYGNMSKQGRGQFAKNPFFRFAGQFMSHVTNVFTTVYGDLPQMADIEGVARATSALTNTVAYSELFNAVNREVGTPIRIGIGDYVPFWKDFTGQSFGNGWTFGQIIMETMGIGEGFIDKITGEAPESGKKKRQYDAKLEKKWERLEKLAAANSGFAGSLQIYRTFDAFTEQPDGKGKDKFFWETPEGKKYMKEFDDSFITYLNLAAFGRSGAKSALKEKEEYETKKKEGLTGRVKEGLKESLRDSL